MHNEEYAWTYDKTLYEERNYSIYEIDKDISNARGNSYDASFKKLFLDACVNAVCDGSAQIIRLKKYTYPRVRVGNNEVSAENVLSYYLEQLGTAEVDFKKAQDFSERIRKSAGMFDGCNVEDALESWIARCIRKYFYGKHNPDYYYKTDWFLIQGEPQNPIPEDYFKFACYVASCFVKYGPSYYSVKANEIFEYVTMLGSDLPGKMKKHGSGELPAAALTYKDASLSCKANDVFATIQIKIKEESEVNYEKTLDYLLGLLAIDFPRSYSVRFQSPQKNYLPIKGLPKKGVHQLFANAVQYTKLHGKIQQYALAAIKRDEWYINLDAENCAMPGTFAVFALGLLDESYAPLVIKYLKQCDNEHSSIQGRFMVAYITKFGFTKSVMEVFLVGVGSMLEQQLPHHKVYAQAIHNEDSLKFLLDAKANMDEWLWRYVLCAIWGNDVVCGKGKQIIKKADNNLSPLYKKIFE